MHVCVAVRGLLPRGAMAKKTPASAKATATRTKTPAGGSKTSSRSTVSGPARKDAKVSDAPQAKMAGTQRIAEAMPFNPTKPGEFGPAALDPQPGATVDVPDPRVTGSTLTESTASPKVGSNPNLG